MYQLPSRVLCQIRVDRDFIGWNSKQVVLRILDEPTASLDPISEAEIYEKLGEIIKDRTAIFISHRLSSCKFSDKIIVFDKGEIAETGDHDSLISKNGMYKKLWDAQAEFYV